MQIISEKQISMNRITKSMLYHQGEPFATSNQIAKYFGKPHNDLLKKIRSFHHFEELKGLGKISHRIRAIKGREYPYFELDADAFAFICLSITGKKAEAFKWIFIEAFKKATLEAITAKVSTAANKANHKWVKAREHGKDTRKLLTDKVKEFCEYAEDQRGKTYTTCPYYKHITDAIYSHIGVSVPQADESPRDIYSGDIVEAIESAELEVIKLLDNIIKVKGTRKNIKPLIVTRLKEAEYE